MAAFDGYSDLRRSGLQRLRDAEELLQQPSLQVAGEPRERHLQGAIYLSGYGVECLIKVYIILNITQTSRLSDARDQLQARDATVPDICSAAGHNLRRLLSLTDLEAHMGTSHRAAFDLSAKWSSTLRYDPRIPKRQDAEDRVAAARTIVGWINGLVSG